MDLGYEAKIFDLIILCRLIDNFEDFYIKFNLEARKSTSYQTFFNDLKIVSSREMLFGKSNVKRFYKENKDIIDIIINHTDLLYTLSCPNPKSTEVSGDEFLFFYHYIMANKEKINNIVAILNKLNDLGFKHIRFVPGYDFARENYCLDAIYSNNAKQLYYFDNIKIHNVINVDSSPIIFYNTTSSTYCFFYRINKNDSIPVANDEIILNDLTFDASRLPNDISKKELFDVILKKANFDNKYSNMDINELYSQYNQIILKINNEPNESNKNKSLAQLRLLNEELNNRLRAKMYDSSEDRSYSRTIK